MNIITNDQLLDLIIDSISTEKDDCLIRNFFENENKHLMHLRQIIV